MENIIIAIMSFTIAAVFACFAFKEQKRINEEKRQEREWRDSVLDVLTSMKQRLVK